MTHQQPYNAWSATWRSGSQKKDRDFAFQALLREAEFSRPSIIVRNFEVYVQEYFKFKEHLTDT